MKKGEENNPSTSENVKMMCPNSVNVYPER